LGGLMAWGPPPVVGSLALAAIGPSRWRCRLGGRLPWRPDGFAVAPPRREGGRPVGFLPSAIPGGKSRPLRASCPSLRGVPPHDTSSHRLSLGPSGARPHAAANGAASATCEA